MCEAAGPAPDSTDIEELVRRPRQNNNWTAPAAGQQPPRVQPPGRGALAGDLREYVRALEQELQRRLSLHKLNALGPLTHDDFHSATSVLNKSRAFGVYGKPQIIHAYRQLVHDGEVPFEPQIEALCIKKVGKSSYGGVNLSLFIPPGHSAPLWNISVQRSQDDGALLVLQVLEQKSTYSLLGYREYCRLQPEKPVLIAPGLQVENLEAKRATLRRLHSSADSTVNSKAAGGSSNRKSMASLLLSSLFDLSLDNCSTGDIITELFALQPGEPPRLGTLKGRESLKTCTFGCVYCPTEVDADGEQANPKSYLTHESGVLRAVRNGYSTVEQVWDRIDSLESMGHNASKVFVRIVGGTWSVITRNAQRTFVRDALYALNTMAERSAMILGGIASKDASMLQLINANMLRTPLSLDEEITRNETAGHRAVELCVEDHPKMVTAQVLRENRALGVSALCNHCVTNRSSAMICRYVCAHVICVSHAVTYMS